jgi:DNA adenine methylase
MSDAVRSSGLRPPLKWAGGKRWQVPYLRGLWRDHTRRRFVEPFCGGLAVALGLDPQLAILNDANPHLINFYRQIQRGLATTDLAMHNDEKLFYRHRARFNALLAEGGGETTEAAELFYYLNRTGYNGLCRFNRQGRFNVPFGRYTTIRYARDFGAYRDTFARWTFTNLPFEQLRTEPGDFIYADPPYDVTFTQYARGGFSWTDQERAADWLASHAGPVVLVNQATPRIERLYRDHGFAISHLNGPRRISCTGDRAPAKEIVATRNL